jgi:hypothetical protein
VPPGPMFLRHGWQAMPPPPWRVWVFYIRRPPAAKHKQDTDHSLISTQPIRERQPKAPRFHPFFSDFSRRRGDPGTAGQTRSISVPETGMRVLEAYLAGDHKRTGRGDQLLTCGDVESNPGPARPNPRAENMDMDDSTEDLVDIAHALPLGTGFLLSPEELVESIRIYGIRRVPAPLVVLLAGRFRVGCRGRPSAHQAGHSYPIRQVGNTPRLRGSPALQTTGKACASLLP